MSKNSNKSKYIQLMEWLNSIKTPKPKTITEYNKQ